MKKLLLIIIVSIIFVIGCLPTTGNEWAKFSQSRGDVSAITKGMCVNDIKLRLGMPIHVIHGENASVGWEEWVYKTGSIFLYRMRVMEVEIRPDNVDAPEPDTETSDDVDYIQLKEEKTEKTSNMEGYIVD